MSITNKIDIYKSNILIYPRTMDSRLSFYQAFTFLTVIFFLLSSFFSSGEHRFQHYEANYIVCL